MRKSNSYYVVMLRLFARPRVYTAVLRYILKILSYVIGVTHYVRLTHIFNRFIMTITLSVNCPLWVSQPGQLSLSSLRGERKRIVIYVLKWLRVKVRGRGLGPRPIGCTPAVSHKSAAVFISLYKRVNGRSIENHKGRFADFRCELRRR